MHKKIIQTILFSYPSLNSLADGAETAAQNKALLSFSNRGGTMRAAEEVAAETLLCLRYLELEQDVEEALSGLGAEQRQLIGERYFFERPSVHLCSERTLFRRRSEAERQIGCALELLGWSDVEFLRQFKKTPLARILGRLLSGRKPQHRQGSESSEGGERLFPRRTKTATATAAPAARQRSTTCRAEGGEAGVPPTSTAGSSGS